MFLHHFFTFPSWYVESISYPELAYFASHFCQPLKICVPVFAFLTGYLYYFNPDKSFKYSFRKITDLLINYWAVYLPLLVIAVLVCEYRFEPTTFLYELFALKRPVMIFCWYVYFYYTAMLLLPVIVKFLLNKQGGGGMASFLLVFVGTNVACQALGIKLAGHDTLLQVINDFRSWFPSVISGYCVAEYKIFENYFDKCCNSNWGKYQKRIVWLLLLALPFVGRYYSAWFTIGYVGFKTDTLSISFSTDMLYAPCFIYALICFINDVERAGALGRAANKVLSEIGKKSMLMWFVHCIFFSGATKEVLQPYLYFLHEPILVTLWGLAVTYAVAFVLDKITKPLIKAKNETFFN